MQRTSAKVKIVVLLIGFCLFYSCSTAKKVPEGKYLLKVNNYNFIGEKRELPSADLGSFIKEKPNNKVLGIFPVKLWLYNAVNTKLDDVFNSYERLPENNKNQTSLDSLYIKNGFPKLIGRTKWFGRFLNRNSEKPVIVDTLKINKSGINLNNYFKNYLGYFKSNVKIEYKKKRKKAKVNYRINLKERASIDAMSYVIKNKNVRDLYESQLLESKIKEGQFFNISTFQNERNRLLELYTNNGYYNFDDSSDQIRFFIDSIGSQPNKLKVELKILSDNEGMSDRAYKLEDIYIYGDSKFFDKKKTENENLLIRQYHKGYSLRFFNKSKFRPRVYTDLIIPEPGQTYNLSDIRDTKRKIFRSENFVFTDLETRVTSVADSTMVMSVWLQPKKKYDLEVFFEGAFSEFLGFGMTQGVRLTTRNVFNGGENLSFTFRGTVGTVSNDAAGTNSDFFNAFDLSFQSKITFPRFFFPLDLEDVIPKRWDPKSDISIGVNLQRNIGLGRLAYNAGFGYQISPTKTIKHSFRLFNTDFINNIESSRYFDIFSSDRDVFNNAINAFDTYDAALGNSLFGGAFQTQVSNGTINSSNAFDVILNSSASSGFSNSLPIGSYSLDNLNNFANLSVRRNRLIQDLLINSFVYKFTFDQKQKSEVRHPWFLYVNTEYAGTLFRIMNAIAPFENITIQEPLTLGGTEIIKEKKAKGIFGIPFSEFFKIDLDIRKQFVFNTKSSLVFRQFLGLIIPFSNSNQVEVPFDRAYFAGGSNDIRAWRAFSLGPGGGTGVGDFSVENMKLTWNAEYRFNLIGKMNSALFVDAGNIWSLDEGSDVGFKFNNFLNEIAVGSGIGFRYDFTYLLLRIDFAYQLRDPSFNLNDRWRLQDINFLNPTLNFGINYPF